MKKMFCRFISIIITLVIIFNPVFVAAKENPNAGVKIFIDGMELKSDVPPVIINGRTMVPLRAVNNFMGIDTSWDDRTRTVMMDASRIISTEHAVFKGDKNISYVRLAKIAEYFEEKVYPLITQGMRYEPNKKAIYYIVSTKEEYYNRLLKFGNSAEEAQKMAENTSGVTNSNGIIVLDQNWKSEDLDKSFMETISHEFVHFLLKDMNEKNEILAWINEGLAEFMGSMVAYSDDKEFMGNSYLIKNYIPILKKFEENDVRKLPKENIEILDNLGIYPFHSYSSLAFILLPSFNMDNLLNYISMVKYKNMDNLEAFKSAFGEDYESFEKDLMDYLKQLSISTQKSDIYVDMNIGKNFKGSLVIFPENTYYGYSINNIGGGKTYRITITKNDEVKADNVFFNRNWTRKAEDGLISIYAVYDQPKEYNGKKVKQVGFFIKREYGLYYYYGTLLFYDDNTSEYIEDPYFMDVSVDNFSEMNQ